MMGMVYGRASATVSVLALSGTVPTSMPRPDGDFDARKLEMRNIDAARVRLSPEITDRRQSLPSSPKKRQNAKTIRELT
jgi:hypothetical protein